MSFENPIADTPEIPTNPKKSRKKLVISISIFALVLAIGGGFSYKYFSNNYPKFPKLTAHGDIPDQVITTFEDSKKIGFPEDHSGYIDSQCNVSGPNWIANENKKQGVAMNTSRSEEHTSELQSH